jgi:hypothetical protein
VLREERSLRVYEKSAEENIGGIRNASKTVDGKSERK